MVLHHQPAGRSKNASSHLLFLPPPRLSCWRDPSPVIQPLGGSTHNCFACQPWSSSSLVSPLMDNMSQALLFDLGWRHGARNVEGGFVRVHLYLHLGLLHLLLHLLGRQVHVHLGIKRLHILTAYHQCSSCLAPSSFHSLIGYSLIGSLQVAAELLSALDLRPISSVCLLNKRIEHGAKELPKVPIWRLCCSTNWSGLKC